MCYFSRSNKLTKSDDSAFQKPVKFRIKGCRKSLSSSDRFCQRKRTKSSSTSTDHLIPSYTAFKRIYIQRKIPRGVTRDKIGKGITFPNLGLGKTQTYYPGITL